MACEGRIGGSYVPPQSRAANERKEQIKAQEKQLQDPKNLEKTGKELKKDDGTGSSIKGGAIFSEIANDPEFQKAFPSTKAESGSSLFTRGDTKAPDNQKSIFGQDK